MGLQLAALEEGLKPQILVIGVGGAGGNAINNMIDSGLEGVDFIASNTDAQALEHSQARRKIQLGAGVTRGLGAGANPGAGRAAAEESLDAIKEHIDGANMVFITAGMGGGTGTGAAPVIAHVAREKGILTVGVVTKPFHFEGTQRMRIAEQGIRQLHEYVDTLIVIPNQNLFRIANEKTTFADAFKMADGVLCAGVSGVTDLMFMPGLINLDFADIRAVMSEMGSAMMGTGEAEGENRALQAAESAISNPLLDDMSIKGASGVLINITGGPDMTLFEVDEAANRVREEVNPDARIIFGSTFNQNLEGRMRVAVVATGIHADKPETTPRKDMDTLFDSMRKRLDEAKAKSEGPSKKGQACDKASEPTTDSSAFIPEPTLTPEVSLSTDDGPYGESRLFHSKRASENIPPSQGQASSSDSTKEGQSSLFSSRPGLLDSENDAEDIKTSQRTKRRPSQGHQLDIPAFLRRQAN